MILILGLAYLTSITSEVEGLETTITGLMTAVNAIQTSIGGLETTVNGLDTDYTTELAELAAVRRSQYCHCASYRSSR